MAVGWTSIHSAVEADLLGKRTERISGAATTLAAALADFFEIFYKVPNESHAGIATFLENLVAEVEDHELAPTSAMIVSAVSAGMSANVLEALEDQIDAEFASQISTAVAPWTGHKGYLPAEP